MNEAFQAVVGGVSRAASRRTRAVPLPLLAPGLVWLLVFYAIPALNQLYVSLQTGPSRRLRRSTGTGRRLRDALSRYDEQFLRSIGYAATATVLAFIISFPLAYFIAFKAGRWRNLLLLLIILPFFTSLPRADGRVADDPRPTTASSSTCCRRRAARRRRAPAGDAHGRDRRHHLQLPALHGAAAVRVAGEGRPAADRGGDRPLRRRARRRSARSRCRWRCRASSPARC